MIWLKKLLGFKSPLEKKQMELSRLQEKALQAQRNGDLRSAGKFYHEAEMLETEIIEMMAENSDESR